MSHAETPTSERRSGSGTETEISVLPIKTGLRRKFATWVTVLIGGLSLLFFLFYFQQEKLSLTRALEKRGLSLANNLARNVEGYLRRPAAPEIELLLKNLLGSRDIVYVVIHDRDGKLAAASSDVAGSVPPPVGEQDLNTIRELARMRSLPELGDVYDFVVPIWSVRQSLPRLPTPSALLRGLGDEEIRQLLSPNLLSLERSGTVRLGLSLAAIQRELRDKSIVILVFLLAFLLLGVLLVLWLSRVIVDPIQRLARAMRIVAAEHNEFDEQGVPMVKRFRRAGDLDLQVRTRDEIEQLADDFRAMVGKLEDSYERLESIIIDKDRIAKEKTELAEQLQKLNRTLENTVKERTREVVEKNLKLYELSEELQFQKEELVHMNEQLEKTSRLKTAFLANMSHELRTPLNSIIGFAEILKDRMFGDLNERQEKYLNHILASGRHLLQLINNILDLSKVEAGKMKLVLEPFSVNRVIDEVQAIIRTLAYKKNLEIEIRLSPEVVIFGDIAKFKQILYNLLSNAIKFTPEKGRVEVATREVAAGETLGDGPDDQPLPVGEAGLLLTVSDTGIGIPQGELENIFQEFEQTEQTRARGYEGTGLGLALTRKLVELHRGRIWVCSRQGKGTRFSVLLPVKGHPDEAAGEEVFPT